MKRLIAKLQQGASRGLSMEAGDVDIDTWSIKKGCRHCSKHAVLGHAVGRDHHIRTGIGVLGTSRSDHVNVGIAGGLERQVITHHYRKVHRVNQAKVGCNIVERFASVRVDHDKERDFSIKARAHHVAEMTMVRAGSDNHHIHVSNGFVDKANCKPGRAAAS